MNVLTSDKTQRPGHHQHQLTTALPLFLQNQGLWLAVLSVNSSLWKASHLARTFFGLASLLRDAVINIWTTVESAVFPMTVVVCTELNWEIHDIYTVLICWNSKLNITIILNNRGRRTGRNRKTRQKAHAGNTGGKANNTSTDYIQQTNRVKKLKLCSTTNSHGKNS